MLPIRVKDQPKSGWRAAELCSQVDAPLNQLADGHLVACHFPVEKGTPVTSEAGVAG